MGAVGAIVMGKRNDPSYPKDAKEIRSFRPEAIERLPLPSGVPIGIHQEYREAEQCLEAGCFRAGAALFRSVLDKALRASGYKPSRETLQQQIDTAASDGVITEARKLRAHEDIRVLGNDVLHDEWREVMQADVQAARHYTQRILEDLYDDRASVLNLLGKAGRVAEDQLKGANQLPGQPNSVLQPAAPKVQ